MNKIQRLLSLSMFTFALLGASATPAFALRGAVKVDCNGSCANTTLGTVCDSFQMNSTPVLVSCNHANKPADLFLCGPVNATCHGGLTLNRNRTLGMCIDGSGTDAIVSCVPPPL